MKKLYPSLLLLLLVTGCSKDFLKRYDKRIIGTWDLYDVDSRGLGGNTERVDFRDGTFVFGDDGVLAYTDPETGTVYNGDWDINRIRGRDGDQLRVLDVHVTDFNTMESKSELFEEMQFTGTDKFKAFIYSGLHRYVFKFKRR